MPEQLRKRLAHVAGKGVGVAAREARSTTREQWALFALAVVAAAFLGFIAGAFAYSDSAALTAARKENEALQQDRERLAVARSDLDRVARERDDAEKRTEDAEKRLSNQKRFQTGELAPDPAEARKAEEQKRAAEAVAASIKRSAAEVVDEYAANEVAADRAYKGKLVSVTGVVEDIGKDILGTMYVTVSAGDGKSRDLFNCVQCMFGNEWGEHLAKLARGRRLTVCGTCDGKLGNVIFRGCAITAW
jgi:hypothetical protein